MLKEKETSESQITGERRTTERYLAGTYLFDQK
jgi:hypothetical protein